MTVSTKLLKDHVDIEGELRELEHACDSADALILQRAWARFERHLSDHLRAEEQFLFPALEGEYELLIDRARAEHASIRQSLEDLGTAVELHTARKERIDALLRQLRSHSAWEDGELYPLANSALGSGLRARFLAFLGRLAAAA
jgi:hemerythrin-like domain-containing protein